VLINQLVTPGFGSFMAGRRVVGCAQTIVAFAGFALLMVWFGWFFVAVIRTMQWPHAPTRVFWMGVAGVVLFAASWFWALATSLQLLRKAQP
jgi:hypothetical protein